VVCRRRAPDLSFTSRDHLSFLCFTSILFTSALVEKGTQYVRRHSLSSWVNPTGFGSGCNNKSGMWAKGCFPWRLPKSSMAVKAKTSAPQPPHPNHLRGLDKPCCVRSNPHRESGTRFGLRQTLEQPRRGVTFGRGVTRGPLGRLRWSLSLLGPELHKVS
jgi:hypothetical protein